MEFKCDSAHIMRKILNAREIISSRTTLSVLSNVYLKTEANGLIMKATDLNLGLLTRIEGDVTREGAITFHCEKILAILKSLPQGRISFTLKDNGRLLIQPEKRKIEFEIKTISHENFPETKHIDESTCTEIPQKELLGMISHSTFSVSKDETMQYLNGVFIDREDGKLAMVSTDGKRLSYVKGDTTIGEDSLPNIIVPVRILSYMKKNASGEGSFKIGVKDGSIHFLFDSQRIYSNGLEGPFPRYKAVIPEKQTHIVRLKRDDLLEALKRTSILTDEKSKKVYLILTKGCLTLNSEESKIGLGSAKEEIPCSYEGDKEEIAVRYTYFVEPLKVIQEEEISLEFTTALKAITLKGSPEKQYFHIIMPMQKEG